MSSLNEDSTNWALYGSMLAYGGYVTCNKCGGQRFQTYCQVNNLECETTACGGTLRVRPNMREEDMEQYRNWVKKQAEERKKARKVALGDWVCAGCSFEVFGSKNSCPKCNTRRGDWKCSKCNYKVFAGKTVCPKCSN